jgi:predicted transcriptional regulator
VSDILNVCAFGANKTKIVYQANLNFKTINPYLDFLTKNGLLDLISGPNKVYKTTSKGAELMQSFKLVHDELSEL